MALTNAFRDLMAAAAIGAAYTAFNNANSNMGVGTGTAAFDATHTDLQGGTKTRKAMDATFPTRVANVITFQSTYASAEGNHAWDEWGVFNAAAAGTMMNRKVEALGTKTAAGAWTLNVAITLNVA